MLIRKGHYTMDGYAGGEYYKNSYAIEAKGKNKKELDREVERLTKEYSSKGSEIDYGYICGTQVVYWDTDILKVTKYK